MHAKHIDTYAQQFQTRYEGLSKQEVEERRQQHGANKLAEGKKTPLLVRFVGQFKDMLVIILMCAAALSFFLGEGIDGLIITLIILINAAIGFFQEYKADRTLEALKHMVTALVTVRRDGEEQRIDVVELVPGDIIKLAEGDKIAADGILLETNELKIEESALTGEAVPVIKQDFDGTISEENSISMGTTVVYGSGLAVITATGMHTQFGRIAKLTSETIEEPSPLQREMATIGVFVGKATLLITFLLLGVIFFRGFTLLDGIIYAISIAVAAVPEGLPAAVSIALALGVERMAKKKAIVKKLASVETLGATTVICSDKTGTLTANMMTVTEVYIPGDQTYHFQGGGYDYRTGGIVEKELSQGLHTTLRIAALANEAHIRIHEDETEMVGDPTEGALLTAYGKAAHISKEISNLDVLIQSTAKVKTFPFDSVRKRMSVVTKEGEVFSKGAPDELLRKCTHIWTPEGHRLMTENDRTTITQEMLRMSRLALRTIGCAYKMTSSTEITKEQAEEELTFTGLIGMMDPPREDVPEAVRICKQAGVRIIMITGDFAETAKAIAVQTGIATQESIHCITGHELETMSKEERIQALQHHNELIFARVAPHHKMEIVELLQKLGEVVAVTGDGVNDAPALKKANIGIAMGISGTDVSKEAADMVLTDDSFATIKKAIEEGRTIYANLVKFVWFIFSCNIGEIVLIALCLIAGFPLPLTALMILLVNLGTDVLPALALGVDPSNPTYMHQTPRNPKKRIMERPFYMHFISIASIMGIMVFGLYCYTIAQLGYFDPSVVFGVYEHQYAMSVAFAAIVCIQMANALNAKEQHRSLLHVSSWNNPYLLGAILISLSIVLICLYVPFFSEIFEMQPLAAREWIAIAIVSLFIIVVEEIRKFITTQKA